MKIKESDISKKTVAIILSCAILLSIFSTIIVLKQEPILKIKRYTTAGSQGQVSLAILPPPKLNGAVSIEIVEPSEKEEEGGE